MRLHVNRRNALLWVSSITAGAFAVAVFHGMYQGTRLGRAVGGALAYLSRRPHTARDARKRRLATPAWEESNLVLNTRTRVLHWPHPNLFRLRYTVKDVNQETAEASRWKEIVQSDVRINRRRSGTVLEQLALASIDVSRKGDAVTFAGIDRAVEVLEKAIALPENARDRRLFELLGRLVSLGQETNVQQAFEAMRKGLPITPVRPRSSTQVRRDRLTPLWASDMVAFRLWHEKSNSGNFRHRLSGRIEAAKQLVEGGGSSSGKDTVE